jgi:hypothetical protein
LVPGCFPAYWGCLLLLVTSSSSIVRLLMSGLAASSSASLSHVVHHHFRLSIAASGMMPHFPFGNCIKVGREGKQ